MPTGRSPLQVGPQLRDGYIHHHLSSATVSVLNGSRCNARVTSGCRTAAHQQPTGSQPYSLTIINLYTNSPSTRRTSSSPAPYRSSEAPADGTDLKQRRPLISCRTAWFAGSRVASGHARTSLWAPARLPRPRRRLRAESPARLINRTLNLTGLTVTCWLTFKRELGHDPGTAERHAEYVQASAVPGQALAQPAQPVAVRVCPAHAVVGHLHAQPGGFGHRAQPDPGRPACFSALVRASDAANHAAPATAGSMSQLEADVRLGTGGAGEIEQRRREPAAGQHAAGIT